MLARRRSDWVLGIAGEGLSTPSVYAELDRLRAAGPADGRQRPPDLEPVITALRNGSSEALADVVGNDLQPAALGPPAAAAPRLAAADEAGALAALVSGSGPTIAALAADEDAPPCGWPPPWPHAHAAAQAGKPDVVGIEADLVLSKKDRHRAPPGKTSRTQGAVPAGGCQTMCDRHAGFDVGTFNPQRSGRQAALAASSNSMRVALGERHGVGRVAAADDADERHAAAPAPRR